MRVEQIDGALYEGVVSDLASGRLQVWWTEGPDLQNIIVRVFGWAMVDNSEDVAGLVLTGGFDAEPYKAYPWIHRADKANIILDVVALKEGAL